MRVACRPTQGPLKHSSSQAACREFESRLPLHKIFCRRT
nr:MAG TPA: hypothetical protein [Caudoviricetes sp.]